MPDISPHARYDVARIAQELGVRPDVVRSWFRTNLLKGRYLGGRRGYVTTGRMLLEFLEGDTVSADSTEVS